MKLRYIIIFILIFVLTFSILLYNKCFSSLSELEQRYEDMEIHNYNMEIVSKNLSRSKELMLKNKEDIFSFFDSNNFDYISAFNEDIISDIDYFRYIVDVNSQNNLDFVLRENQIRNYQFYDDVNEKYIDYYFYMGEINKPITLEIVYYNGKIIDSNLY